VDAPLRQLARGLPYRLGMNRPRRTFPSQQPSHRGEAVVDEQLGAVEEGGVVAEQEEGGLGDLLRLAHAALLRGDGGVGRVDALRGEPLELALAVTPPRSSPTCSPRPSAAIQTIGAPG
jgi:hypothetical protein